MRRAAALALAFVACGTDDEGRSSGSASGLSGLTLGGTYDLDFFFAERHTSESNFRIETTIGCFHPPG